MKKYVSSQNYEGGSFAFGEILQSHGLERNFHKTANQYPEAIKEFVSKISPQNGKIFVVIAPMGMGEYWGPNVNGDFFPEAALCHKGDDYGYQTFLKSNMFRHHINKDPRVGFGNIVCSEIDKDMGRIVVVSCLDIEKMKRFGAGEFLQMLEKGELPEVSMGCTVPYDVCSICGNKAKSPAFYCDHVKPQNMLKVDSETGKVAFVINHHPKFFDLSFVHKGADRSSGTLEKVAKELKIGTNNFYLPSALHYAMQDKIALESNEEKNNEVCEKIASIIEKCGSDLDQALSNSCSEQICGSSLPKPFLDLMSKFAYEEIYGTMFSLGMPLTDREIQYMALRKEGFHKEAEIIFDKNITLRRPELIEVGDRFFSFNDFIQKNAMDYFEGRTLFQPFFLKRVSEKTSSDINDIDAMNIAAKTTLAFSILDSLLIPKNKTSLSRFQAASLVALASMIGAKASGSEIKSRNSFQREGFGYKQSSDDLVSSISDAIGGRKGLGTLAIIAASNMGYQKYIQNKKDESRLLNKDDDLTVLQKAISNYPKITAAATMTLATPAGMKAVKKTFNIVSKAISDKMNKKSSDKTNFLNLLNEEQKNDILFLDNLSLKLMEGQNG